MAIRIKALRLGGIHILAVIAGTLIDMIGSNILSSCYLLVVTMPSLQIMMQQGYSGRDMQEFVLNQTEGSAIVWIIGALMTLIGGYIAGLIAKRDQVVNGFATGVLVSVLSILMNVVLGPLVGGNRLDDFALWQHIVIFGGHILAAGLGGYLASLKVTLADS